MESPLLTFVVLLGGVMFGYFCSTVESQQNGNNIGSQSRIPPPPPVSQSSPPPPVSQSPPPPSPPPPSPPPPSPPPPSPPPFSPPPPSPPSPRPPPPPPPPPPPRRMSRNPSPAPRNNGSPNRSARTGPPRRDKMNLGKTIGLLFLGIVVILQVCVAAFLVIKRRQLVKGP